MAKFLNKKEQVIDFKLTSYGHYLLSNGNFKPMFYGFYDDNVIYDAKYINIDEAQNNINVRIKEETPYIESLVLFDEVEKSVNTLVEEEDNRVYFEVDVTPTNLKPRKDVFRFETMIGDANLEGATSHAPAWKVSMLNGAISSSVSKDLKNDVLVPQINIDANYRLKIKPVEYNNELTNTERNLVETQTMYFSDNKKIVLEQDNVMIYLEELNTVLLNENYDIEIFEIGVDNIPATHANGTKTDELTRKTFYKQTGDLKGKEITKEYFEVEEAYNAIPSNNQAEYYFNIYLDHYADKQVACRGAEIFNKDSYYVDLDFECDEEAEIDKVYYDIYGPVTEPEICP